MPRSVPAAVAKGALLVIRLSIPKQIRPVPEHTYRPWYKSTLFWTGIFVLVLLAVAWALSARTYTTLTLGIPKYGFSLQSGPNWVELTSNGPDPSYKFVRPTVTTESDALAYFANRPVFPPFKVYELNSALGRSRSLAVTYWALPVLFLPPWLAFLFGWQWFKRHRARKKAQARTSWG